MFAEEEADLIAVSAEGAFPQAGTLPAVRKAAQCCDRHEGDWSDPPIVRFLSDNRPRMAARQ